MNHQLQIKNMNQIKSMIQLLEWKNPLLHNLNLKVKKILLFFLKSKIYISGFDPMKMTTDAFNNIKRKFGW